MKMLFFPSNTPINPYWIPTAPLNAVTSGQSHNSAKCFKEVSDSMNIIMKLMNVNCTTILFLPQRRLDTLYATLLHNVNYSDFNRSQSNYNQV